MLGGIGQTLRYHITSQHAYLENGGVQDNGQSTLGKVAHELHEHLLPGGDGVEGTEGNSP